MDRYSEGGTGHGSKCRPGALTPSRPLQADPPLLHRDRDSLTGSSKRLWHLAPLCEPQVVFSPGLDLLRLGSPHLPP